MAGPQEVQIGRVLRFLTKWSGLKGTQRIDIGQEVVPTLALWSGVENRFLDSWNRYGGSVQQNGAAANQSSIRLRNPKGSNLVGVIEMIQIVEAAGDTCTISIGATTTDLTTVSTVNTGRLDARGQPTPTLVLSTSNQVGQLALTAKILGPFIQGNVTYDVIKTINQEITLLPGDALSFDTNTVNTLMRIGFIWRERTLEDSELT